MCGIFALKNPEDTAVVKTILASRGQDGYSDLTKDGIVFGHLLHAMVGHVAQPLVGNGVLVANCEIYNWQELSDTYAAAATNDAQLLLALLDNTTPHEFISVLEELDGVYAFIYYRDGSIYAARDLIGVKPLFYSENGNFASEAKALKAISKSSIELPPQTLLRYEISSGEITTTQREFIQEKTIDGEPKEIVAELLKSAVHKRLSEKKTGILLSGGVDSTVLAKLVTDLGSDVTCYTAVFDNPDGEEAHDLDASIQVAKRYGFNHKIIKITKEELPSIIKKVATEIESTDAVKVSVGIPFYVAAKQAAADGCKLLFSGLGAEELFAGYKRHKDAVDINAECLTGLRHMYERDLYRDDVLTMRQGIELRLPFLDKKLIAYALGLCAEEKIKDGVQKFALREAAQLLGLDHEDAFRPKKAAQYGSKFDRALKRLADKEGLSRVEYIEKLLE